MVYFFSQGVTPHINTVYIKGGDKEEDPFNAIIYSQRCNLTKNEQANLYDIFPLMNIIIMLCQPFDKD
jgi:hypothetical protein